MTSSTTVAPATAAPTDESALDELLSRPSPGVGEALAAAGGDIVLLGAGGKIGPTMARMARRALVDVGSDARVIAVSRFSDAAVREELGEQGIEVRSADLAEPTSYRDLPDAAAMFYLAAMKFGTTGQEHRTWWSNAAMPALVADRYRGVPSVVYSTGNVYPLSPLAHGGSLESEPAAPVGEYAQSCLARERIFTNAAHEWGTPTTIFRLNYACELRYGVIADIAVKIAAGEPVDVTMPAVNVAWQGDVNAWALRSLELAAVPPHILNATGPETVSVRRLATWLAEEMDAEVTFTGTESDDALLNDASECHERYGYPSVPLRRLVRWVGQWVADGGRQLGKATKFQQREGKY
ncbi:NAD-dependent epimerase/dehydratase family protein [Georgenia subflava]|uniref:NAD-dependent epimerase/dehydratase family protein n=1 Tax=Georgenia subflava TaxID=1622177 RepID=A0A6N7EHL3_9MICO|nr:NAD-dependent epimerase/dehydratase family protein [Georgenia subflava]MPV36478.1 NAD-dependent epimerase/dehydratase family protein [Georgenia subflava]